VRLIIAWVLPEYNCWMTAHDLSWTTSTLLVMQQKQIGLHNFYTLLINVVHLLIRVQLRYYYAETVCIVVHYANVPPWFLINLNQSNLRPCLVIHIYKYKTRFCICKWPMSVPSRYETYSHICTMRKFTKSKLQNV